MQGSMKREQVALHKGTNYFAKVFTVGYVTGSGNYLDFFIPVYIPDGLTVTDVTILNTSVCIFGGASRQIGTPVSVTEQNKLGIICEYHFSATQSANNSALVNLIGLTITCS